MVGTNPSVVGDGGGQAGNVDGDALVFNGGEAGGLQGIGYVVEPHGAGHLALIHQGGVNTQDGRRLFAAAVAALPGRVHVPGHEPPVQFSQDTALALDVIAHPVDGLDVAAVAVEDDEAAGAVLEQAVAHPAEHLIEQLGAQVDGAGIVAQALSGAVGDGGADEHVALLLDLVQQEVGDEGVGAQRHVAAVALDGADADENGIVSAEVFLCLGPGQVG